MRNGSTTDLKGFSAKQSAREASDNAHRFGMQNGADAQKDRLACEANGCRHREILRHTLTDAIEALEATRKSFKSKQIEALRKKLTKVLIEES
jgi:hypothetical protein